MAKKLVFVGGGHAHLTALVKMSDYVKQGHSVTLISPDVYHYYSGMGPGMLSRMYEPREVRFNLSKLAGDRGASFVKDRVIRVEAADRQLILESGQTVSYDVVSFNTGSSVPTDLVTGSKDNVYPVKPIINLLKAQRALEKVIHDRTPNILVIGGGPAGVELSGNIHRLISVGRVQPSITLVAGTKLLPALPEKVRDLTLSSFEKRGIQVLENAHVDRIDDGVAILKDGRRLDYGMVFPALGVQPSALFKASELSVGGDGGLLVNDCLQSINHPEIFGGGDCISFQSQRLDKVGVYAVRQNPVLYHNLMAALNNAEMMRFQPQKDYMLIFNLGDDTGIFVRKSWVWNGRLAFILKDYIDRKFMKKFQVSGELEDQSQAF
jgi:NADH dehydrogenase FAD-containing subunit